MSLEKIYNRSLKKMGPRTGSEINMTAYNMHFYFWRFLFAFISLLLSLITLIELYFFQQLDLISHLRNAILVIVLLAVEIGLSLSLNNYYTKKYHANEKVNKTPRRWVYLFLAVVSIFFSSYSGYNTVKIIAHTEQQVIETNIENKTNTEINRLNNQMIKNNQLIEKNDHLVTNNNQLIEDLKKVAITGHGAGQIKNYQEQNKKLQEQNSALILQNNGLLNRLSTLSINTDKKVEKSLNINAKKQFIYTLIFTLTGLFVVLGLIYSYRFIALYSKQFLLDAPEIEILKNKLAASAEPNKPYELVNGMGKKNENENQSSEKPISSGFDLAKMHEIGLDIKKTYILIELQNLLGFELTYEKIIDEGINNLSRIIVERNPTGYKLSEMKKVIGQISKYLKTEK